MASPSRGACLLCWSLWLVRQTSAGEYHWIVQQDVAAPDGYPRSVLAVLDTRFLSVSTVDTNPFNDRLAYNMPQQLPGPEVRVRQGERLIVHVTNMLPTMDISIHWHGIHMKHQAWMDGTAGITGCAIAAGGGTGTYNFTVDQEPGTHWWHSHVGTQYADGLFGTIVIEPAEGQIDPVQKAAPYSDDQTLTVQDWIHETFYDISSRYTTRTGAFTQRIGNKRLPFLPDYPWPSSYVLLNGRGQTDCKMRLWKDCEVIREYGWEYYFNQSDKPKTTPPEVGGLPAGTIGQCMPERPPLMGECNPDARPSALHCTAGGATRFRIVNTGYSMPLRFWIDRHQFTLVARDGVPVVPTGPHHALVISPGQRIDIVVQCDQDPSWRYQAFAMVALREFYPGASVNNYEAHSFAAVTYGGGVAYGFSREPGVRIWRPAWCRRCEQTPLREPEIAPRHFTQAGMTEGCNVGCNYRHRIYSSWNISSKDYLPSGMEALSSPAPKPEDKRREKKHGVVEAPAAQERILISVGGAGNWWNNISAASSNNFGLKFEWWNMNEGANWTNSHSPLAASPEPLMLGTLFGRSLDEMYGTFNPLSLPFVQRLRYNRTAPITYEIVLLNWEGQQHPWHIHGHSLQIVGQGWLDPVAEWRKQRFNATRFDPKTAFDHLPDHTKPAPVKAQVDTFTSAPHSFVVFRLTADNPGAWMMHCHMDYHLEAGMGMLWSVEEDGKYSLPPPPDDFRVCNRDATYAAARALQEGTAAARGTQLLATAEEQLRAAEAEIAALRRDKDLYLYALMGLAVGLAAAAFSLLLPRLPCTGLRPAPSACSAYVPPHLVGSSARGYALGRSC